MQVGQMQGKFPVPCIISRALVLFLMHNQVLDSTMLNKYIYELIDSTESPFFSRILYFFNVQKQVIYYADDNYLRVQKLILIPT